METGTSTDDASIPVSLVSLVQYLWSQWQAFPSSEQSTVAAILGELMRSPRWHWDVIVVPDQSLSDPQGSLVSSCDGRWTISVPITMLRDLWIWVLDHIDKRASVLRWLVPTLDPALWQRLHAWRQTPDALWLTTAHWYRLYPYLLPAHLPELVQEMHHLLSSADPDDHRIALTVLDRWLASPDHETHTLAARMLHTLLDEEHHLRIPVITILAASGDATMDVDRWAHHVAAFIRTHPSDRMIQDTLDRLMPAIWSSVRPNDRVAWAATLWTLITDPTLSDERRQTIATALTPMMQDPMVARLMCDRLRTVSLLHRPQLPPIPRRTWETLLAGLLRTVYVDEVLTIIERTIRQDPDTISWFDQIVAAGWGNGYDQRILQIIDSIPGPHWETVLTQGITTSVGAEVCHRIQSWVPRDQAMALIVKLIHAREKRGDWPLAPLPASLIPWVGDAARTRPYDLHPTTIRRLWRADPDRAWDVTQTMLGLPSAAVRTIALAALDAGWGIGHDAAMATMLQSIILDNQDDSDVVTPGIATAVAGIGIASPSLIATLLTELAMQGNDTVQRRLISALHRGWGQGQDGLVMRVMEIIAERDSSDVVWTDAHQTLIRAWNHLPPDVVVSLVDRLVTRATNGLAKEAYSSLTPWEVQRIIAAFAPIWTYLPTAQVIARIAHHVAHLDEHARTMLPTTRDTLVAAWASVIAAGMERLSASAIHALLAPLWTLSPRGCLNGVLQRVHR
jgi:hypothetical protein